MNVHDMFPSKYVSAYDLHGRDVTVTISRITQDEEFNKDTGEKERIWLLWFEGAKKPMRCKPVHGKTIAALYGDENTAWIGKAITLYATKVKAFGQVFEVVRIRDKKPTKAAASTPPPESLNQVTTDDGDDTDSIIDDIEHELAFQTEGLAE